MLSGCLVFLQFRGGELSGDWKPAGGWCWSHDGSQADIVRYRVRQPKLPPCPDGEGWIEWGGGECPVAGDRKVELQLRSGSLVRGKAYSYEWLWNCAAPYHIVRYRLLHPPVFQFRPLTDEEMIQLVSDRVYLERKDGSGGGVAVNWVRSSADNAMLVLVGNRACRTETLLDQWIIRRDGVPQPCGKEVIGE